MYCRSIRVLRSKSMSATMPRKRNTFPLVGVLRKSRSALLSDSDTMKRHYGPEKVSLITICKPPRRPSGNPAAGGFAQYPDPNVEKFCWNKHIEHVETKLSAATGPLYKLHKYITKSALKAECITFQCRL